MVLFYRFHALRPARIAAVTWAFTPGDGGSHLPRRSRPAIGASGARFLVEYREPHNAGFAAFNLVPPLVQDPGQGRARHTGSGRTIRGFEVRSRSGGTARPPPSASLASVEYGMSAPRVASICQYTVTAGRYAGLVPRRDRAAAGR